MRSPASRRKHLKCLVASHVVKLIAQRIKPEGFKREDADSFNYFTTEPCQCSWSPVAAPFWPARPIRSHPLPWTLLPRRRHQSLSWTPWKNWRILTWNSSHHQVGFPKLAIGDALDGLLGVEPLCVCWWQVHLSLQINQMPHSPCVSLTLSCMYFAPKSPASVTCECSQTYSVSVQQPVYFYSVFPLSWMRPFTLIPTSLLV